MAPERTLYSKGAFNRTEASPKGTRENWRQKETRGDL